MRSPWPRRLKIAGAVIAGLFVLLVILGLLIPPGEDEDGAATSTGPGPVATIAGAGASAGPTGAPAGSQPSSGAGSTATPQNVSLLAQLQSIVPKPPPPPSTPAEMALGGTPDRRAAAEVTNVMQTAGFNLRGIEFYVFPVRQTTNQMLVMQIYEDQNPTIDDDPDPFIRTLVRAPQLDRFRVARITINFYGRDDRGPALFIVTIALPPLRAWVNGQITVEVLFPQVGFQIVRR